VNRAALIIRIESGVIELAASPGAALGPLVAVDRRASREPGPACDSTAAQRSFEELAQHSVDLCALLERPDAGSNAALSHRPCSSGSSSVLHGISVARVDSIDWSGYTEGTRPRRAWTLRADEIWRARPRELGRGGTASSGELEVLIRQLLGP